MTGLDSGKLGVRRLDGVSSLNSRKPQESKEPQPKEPQPKEPREFYNAGATHSWVTVVNPSNQRLLLQACDDCGVVKSENSVVKACKARKGRALLSNAMLESVRLVS